MSGMCIDSKDAAWPPEIEDAYDRVRPLGEGAYGVVWLARAKPKSRQETAVTSQRRSSYDDSVDSDELEDTFASHHVKKTVSAEDDPPYVAIKQIDALKEGEKQYAAREIAILSEINHPNIVRCLRSVEMPRSRLVVLTLADGPDLNELVNEGGALSVSLARLAARHLISAVAYLHARGVIHRDIKPDNCILTKADESKNHHQSKKDDWMSSDIFWDDKAVFDEKEWKVVLVDFGFAKALTPKECMYKAGKSSSRGSVRNLVQRGIDNLTDKQKSELDSSDKAEKDDSSSRRGISSSRHGMRRGASFQRVPIRAMSAIGTRAFAAPEVRKAREKTSNDSALAENVADYGLISDAFSIGVTIKVLLTGVPADKSEMEFIGAQNNVLANILSAIFSCGSKDGGKRKKRYKFLDEAPKPARELVKKLMKPVYADRLTAALARDEPWIMGGVDASDPVVTLPVGDIPAGNDDPIKCLNCATGL